MNTPFTRKIDLALPVDCADCAIRERAVCSRCSPPELDQLNRIKYYKTVEAGQTIVWAGDEMDFVASLVTGIATLTQRLEDGRTQMVGLLLPSDFLGRPGRAIAAFDVKATTDVKLCCFRRKPFEALLEQTPSINQRLLEISLDELDAARDWMLLLGRKNAREKIATLLAIVVRRNAVVGEKTGVSTVTFELPLTREAMADYLGLTLETVSRQMSALRKAGVISLEGQRKVTIPDLDRLLTETGDDAGFALLG